MQCRLRTPSQNASLLQYLATTDIGSRPGIDELAHTTEPQTFYDEFYAFATGLLHTFYPESTVTVTSRGPSYVTPEIEVKLRRKNRLMRAGRVEQAGALAPHIGRDITRRSKHQLCKLKKSDSKELWTAVRQLTGRVHQPAPVTAEALNQHYATVSTDAGCERPPSKDTAAVPPGLDGLPVWFLRLAAPAFCGPVADLINLTDDVNCAVAVKGCVHPAGTEDGDTAAADGLPVDLDNAGTHPPNRVCRHAALHLPYTVVAPASSAIRRSVRLPLNRLHHCDHPPPARLRHQSTGN